MLKKNIVAIIPARGDSKRILGKNYKKFNGEPIIVNTIKKLKKSKIFNRIIVSTDNNYTIFNNNNNLILIDITDVQVIDYVVFTDISYKAPIIPKPTTKPVINSKPVELKLNNGSNNINLNLNIDNKVYNKLKEVYEIQKMVGQNIPRLKIKNNCY